MSEVSENTKEYVVWDDSVERVTIYASSAQAAAQEYVDDGAWDPAETTWWARCSVREVCEDCEDCEVCEGCEGCEGCTVEQIKIAVDPPEPACECDQHVWTSPHAVLGGLEENPGVLGHGGGALVAEWCPYCGTIRTIDTWAQDPMDGEQGLRGTRYRTEDGLIDRIEEVALAEIHLGAICVLGDVAALDEVMEPYGLQRVEADCDHLHYQVAR